MEADGSAITPVTSAPLPAIGVMAPALSREENPWHVVRTVFVVNIQPEHRGTPPIGVKGKIYLSLFRMGEAVMDEAGIHFKGMGIKRHDWLKILAMVGCVLWIVCQVFLLVLPAFRSWSWGPGRAIPHLYAPFAGLMLYSITARFYEYRRIPMEFSILWSDLVEAYISPGRDGIRLVYWESLEKKEKTLLCQLPIAPMSLPITKDWRKIIKRFAPSCVRPFYF